MAIVSSGQLVLPAGLGDGQPVTAGAGVDLPHYLDLLTRTASYSAVYRTQPWIAAAVNKLALSTARLPLKTYRRTDTGREDAAETPLGRLLARPNRRDSAKFFWLWTVSTFELYGEAIWVKSRPGPGRAPTALWPMHPANVRTYYDDRGSVIYQYLPEPTGAYWPAEDVVHFRSYNPDDQLRGLSRLEPLRSSLISEDAVRKANESWWLNGARPSVVLQHPATIGDAPQRRIKESWERLHSGVQNWGKAAILEEGMTAQVMQLTAQQMEMVDSRKLSREEVCGVYDVPPPVLHILDKATFSNITEQMRSMYRDTMAPRLGVFESELEVQLRPDFDPQDRLYSEFLMDEVLRGDFEQRVESYQKGISSGWLKPAEARASENLPDAGESADQLFVNAALVPMTSQPSKAPPRQTQEPATRSLESARRSVLGRLSRTENVADLDVEELVRGVDNDGVRAVVAAHVAAAEDVPGLRRQLTAALSGDSS